MCHKTCYNPSQTWSSPPPSYPPAQRRCTRTFSSGKKIDSAFKMSIFTMLRKGKEVVINSNIRMRLTWGRPQGARRQGRIQGGATHASHRWISGDNPSHPSQKWISSPPHTAKMRELKTNLYNPQKINEKPDKERPVRPHVLCGAQLGVLELNAFSCWW